MPFHSRPSWGMICFLVLLIAFSLRVSAGIWWQSKAESEGLLFRFGDSNSYWTLASRISHGEPFQYGSDESKIFRVPLYPAFLAPFTLMPPQQGVLAARIAGCLLGTLCVYLVMIGARHAGGDLAGLGAGVLSAFAPGAIGMSIFVLSEAIFCPLAILSLLCWVKTLESPSNTHSTFWACCSGVFTGFACLARPSWVLWPAALIVFIAIQSTNHRVQFRKFALFALFVCLIMSPWWIRNYSITARFVPTTLQVGATLYDSLHPGASGGSDENMIWVDRFASEQRAIDELEKPVKSTFEYRLDRRMANAAIAWALENPTDVAKLGLLKFRRTWSPFLSAEQVANKWFSVFEAIAFVTTLVFGLFGWWFARRESLVVRLFTFPLLYFAGLHLIFVGSVRYRQPAMLMLCVVAGIGLASCWRYATRSRLQASNVT